MEIHSYNAELAVANLMFALLFRNISLERKINNKTTVFNVPAVMGQRSRILKNYENAEKKATMKLPMIIINRTGYQRNPDRVNNLHNEVKYEQSGLLRNYNLLTPIPIDINYELTVVAKLPGDIDHIISNFMIFFNNDVFVSCKHPKYEGIQLTNQVVMEDSVSEENLDELDGTTDDLITATCNFVFKTYLFGGNDTCNVEQKQEISTFISTYFEHENDEFPISAQVSAIVNVDNVYNGFVPMINHINVGFYPVNNTDNFIDSMNYVDNHYSNKYHLISGNIQLSDDIVESQIINKYNLSLSYVDRLIWKIDESPEYNVKT